MYCIPHCCEGSDCASHYVRMSCVKAPTNRPCLITSNSHTSVCVSLSVHSVLTFLNGLRHWLIWVAVHNVNNSCTVCSFTYSISHKKS